LLAAKPALVVTVWQPTAALDSLAWSGATARMVNFVELDRAGAEDGRRVAHEGVRIAHEAGLEAEPVAIKATGPVWETIIETDAQHNAAAIVMGSRGSRACARCCSEAPPAPSCSTLTGPPWSYIAATTSTLRPTSRPDRVERERLAERPMPAGQPVIETKPPTIAP
jgi:hypothetical protein